MDGHPRQNPAYRPATEKPCDEQGFSYSAASALAPGRRSSCSSANMCSYGGDDPARRRRLVLRVGRAAGRPAPARPARDRRRVASCSRRATRPRRTASARRWAGAQARRLCPARDRRLASDGGVHRGQQGDVRGVRGHDAARRGAVDRRGVPRRPRHAADRRARRPRSRRACGARCASGSGSRSRSASRARSSSPRSRAGSPSRTACSSCRPTASSTFLHPLPVERLWGVGPVTAAQAARPRHPDRRPGGAAAAGARSSRCSGARRAGICTPSPTTATPARADGPPPGLDRLAARARPLAHAAGGDRRRRSSRWSTASRGACAAPSASGRTVVLRLRFDDFSRATRSHTLPRATAETERDPRAPRAACSPRPRRWSSASGLTLVGRRRREPRGRARGAARAAVRRARRGRARQPRSTRSATASARARSREPCSSVDEPAWRCRCCPTELSASRRARARPADRTRRRRGGAWRRHGETCGVPELRAAPQRSGARGSPPPRAAWRP